jgi:hypothetical protein
MPRDLAKTMQALYNSEINFTITILWNGGFDFALVSYIEYEASTKEQWHNVGSAAELADALHERALIEVPQSTYARRARGELTEPRHI